MWGLGFEARGCDGEDHNLNRSQQFCWAGILLVHSAPQHHCFPQSLVPYKFLRMNECRFSSIYFKRAPHKLFPSDHGPVLPPTPQLPPFISLSSALSIPLLMLPTMNQQNNSLHILGAQPILVPSINTSFSKTFLRKTGSLLSYI